MYETIYPDPVPAADYSWGGDLGGVRAGGPRLLCGFHHEEIEELENALTQLDNFIVEINKD